MNNNRCERRQRKRMPNARALPHRWLDYDPVGKDMPGTRFVAFKTPLRSVYFKNRGEHFKPEQVFETQTLVKYAAEQGKQLGLVIDLTATDKYYDPRDWAENNIEHVKLKCAGHFAHTDADTARLFVEAVSKFLRDNAHNDKLIGVHCTHGLNRTGYMICKYLIEVDGFDPQHAINVFEYCRGYKIERGSYIDALCNHCVRGRLSHLAVPYVKCAPLSFLSSAPTDDLIAAKKEVCVFLIQKPTRRRQSKLDAEESELKKQVMRTRF